MTEVTGKKNPGRGDNVALKRMFVVLMALGLVAAGCGDSDDAEDVTPGVEATEGEDGEAGGGEVDPAEIETGAGITEDTIRVGLLADLSGIFAPLVVDIVEAHNLYWEMINENGGIAGRQVEPVVVDAGYDVPRTIELYQELRQDGPEGVAMISLSVGSPHTSAIIPEMQQDNMVAIPLTWYSGWSDPEFGATVAEMYTTYCLEAHNALSYMNDKVQEELGEDMRLAIISFPGEYGEDGATGAKMAAEALGVEIVYDGQGQVVPGADQTPIISEIIAARPNVVWAGVNPTALSELFGGVQAQNLDAYWTGASPSFDFRLLGTDLGPDLSELYTFSTYVASWGADVEGMDEMVAEMVERSPDLPVSDPYIFGWTYAEAAHQILQHAADMGDLTREGIVAALQDPELEATFGGLAPAKVWGGEDPNEYLVRESFIYSLDSEAQNLGPISQEDAATGLVLEEANYVSDIAEAYEWDGPCFAPQG